MPTLASLTGWEAAPAAMTIAIVLAMFVLFAYPILDEWIAALGDDPFHGPQRTCQESNF